MDINQMNSAFENQQDAYEKDFKNASGEKLAGKLEYSGSYLMRPKTVKYKKDGKEKEFPNVEQDKNKGYRCNMVLEVADGTQDVPEGASAYMGFPITSGSSDAKKRYNAANMFKGRLKSLAPEGVVESFQLNGEWIAKNILGEFKAIEDSDDFETVRETKLSDLVYVKFECDINPSNNQPKLEVTDVRKAKPGDISKQGKKLDIEEVEETSVPTEESAPKFDNNTDSGDKTSNEVMDEF